MSKIVTLLLLAANSLATMASAAASRNNMWQKYASDFLEESMTFMDPFWDPYAGYLIDTDINNGFSALYHTTRESSWYAAGLLARNRGNDKYNAAKIIKNIISKQFTNTSVQWYGDYQIFPEQPTPGTAAYPAVIYNSWDPNWRAFIATTFVLIVEEYSHLLSEQLIDEIVASILLAAKGNTYRVGGIDGDNFYPSYSNPAIMSAAFAGWVGIRTGDANITAYGSTLASEIVELFDKYDTLSEYNSPTYAGVTIGALTMWAKYFDESTVQGKNGGRILTAVWDNIANTYNANLKNMAGPWDRTYGWDMNRYVAITALWIWTAVGKEKAPVYETPGDMAHVSDFQYIFPGILGPYHNTFLSENALAKLNDFPGEHVATAQARSPPYDYAPRNYTTWLSAGLTIGMETFDESQLGGPTNGTDSFSPAVVQWLRRDGSVGFISLIPSETAMEGRAGANVLTLTWPQGDADSHFTFLVSPNGLQGPHDVQSWEDFDGINVNVSGTVDLKPAIAYCGAVGGLCEPVDLFELWNFTYTMPVGSTATPSITMNIKLDD